MGIELDPKPIKGEKSFAACQREPFIEDPGCYQIWESVVKKLFIQFQFFFEYLGPGSPGRKYLEEAKKAGSKNLDGSEIHLPDLVFDEKKDVHLQLYFADGSCLTSYKFADGCNGDFHFSGIEPNNLFAFVPPYEFAPLVFPTHQNFYEESVNQTFLNNPKYDKRPQFPIYHSLHQEVFTPRYFKKILKLPADFLTIDFSCEKTDTPKEIVKAVRTLNFSLTLLYAVCLLESAYIDIFGKHRDPLSMIRYLEKNWRLGKGNFAKGLNSYHLFILQFLLKISHLSGYGLAASLYRLKNGPHSYNPGHGTWHIGGDKDHTPFKIFLEKQIRLLIAHWCKQFLRERDKKAKDKLSTQINTAVKLGELFGLGYQVDTNISKAYYFNQPVDFRPDFAQSEEFSKVNFVAQLNIESPLWRVYYLYSRKMWKNPQENQSIFAGEGETWNRNKNHPRAVLYNILHEYQLKFLLDNIRYMETSLKDEQSLKKLKETKEKLLESINPERREFILSLLA